MLRLGMLAISLLILVLAALPSTTSSQNQRARGQQNKFIKRANKIPNRYIVVLNDDVADNEGPREARLERVTKIANEHALAHLGRPDYIYETALKGYAIELPNEAAAEAISRRPEVQWVEEDQELEKLQVPASPQPSPPWNLDAIDGDLPTPNIDLTLRTTGSYIFHGTGAGVDAYVIDSGINTRHVEFGPPPFSTRATQAADCIRNVDCRQGQASGFVEGPCIVSGMPNTVNNDCDGHGTLVAGVIGGINFGVAKAVNIKSIKVCTLATCPASALVQGINWLTRQHFTDSSVPKVANISLGYHDSFVHNPPTPNNSSIDLAVNNSINTGITYVIAAGNSDIDARTFHPAAVPAALTIGAVESTARRWFASNWGPGIDLWAPGDRIRSALTGVGGGPFGTCILWDGTDSDDCFDSGTSLAAPHVAGAVAIYFAESNGFE